MSNNREFLIAVFAVQAGYIDQSQLQELLRETQEQSKASLLEMLISDGLLTNRQVRELSEKAEVFVRKPGTTSDASRTAGLNTPTVQRDDDVKGNTEHTLPSNQPVKESKSSEFEATTSIHNDQRRDNYVPMETVQWRGGTRSRYTLTREHGRGGLGCVWIARDSVLNREVALKEVINKGVTSKNQQKRLVREAQITGQLEHPNIVPVYELSGVDEDTPPFYTMRFLRGATLSERIKERRKARKRGEDDPMAERQLLRAFTAICHAISYAHARQIIHRDLKPSNVLTGDFGEVVVLDWGLAKSVKDPKERDVDIKEVTFTNPESYTCTPEGQALGTPAYMAPEQASGQISLTDELTDIYGLGAILFAIVTGAAPHLAHKPRKKKTDNTYEMLRRIYTLPTPRIRNYVPTAPAALDAICAKAMAKSRGDRYRTVSELADDVERFLADQPVSVLQESIPQQFFRWLRRHRTLAVASACVLLITSLAGGIVSMVTIDANSQISKSLENEKTAHQTAASARTAEERAKGQALQQFRMAQDAIDRSLEGVNEVMGALPGTESMRIALLQQATKDYKKLLAVDQDDLQLQREAARTRIRLADVFRMMHDTHSAEEQYFLADQELNSLEELKQIDAVQLQLDRAIVASKLALLYQDTGQHDKALDAFSRIPSAAETSTDNQSHADELQILLAGTNLNRAESLKLQQQSTEALELVETSVAQFTALDQSNVDQRVSEGLATGYRVLGELQNAAGKSEQAIESLKKGIVQYRDILAIDQDNASAYEGMAHTRMLLGNTLRKMGHELLPVEYYRKSIEGYLQLQRLQPGRPAHSESIAAGRINTAQMLYRAGRSRDARVYLEDAVAALIDLTQSHPQIPSYRRSKANALITLSMVLRDLNEDDLAETALFGGLEEFGWLSEDYPEIARYTGDHGIAVMSLGRLKSKQGDKSAARAQFTKAISELSKVVSDDPALIQYQDSLAWAHFYLGQLLADDQLTKQLAEEHHRKAIEIREAMPNLPEIRRALVRILTESPLESVADPKRAVGVAEALCLDMEQNASCRLTLATAQLVNEDYEQATQNVLLARSLREQPNAFDLFILAIAQHRSDQREQASEALEKAIALMDEQAPGRIELLYWRKQAQSLINEPSGSQTPTDPER